MPHSAFEIISKTYTRRKTLPLKAIKNNARLQLIFSFNCKSKSYVDFHAENFR